MDFTKYYFLEDHICTDVKDAFHRHGYLTSEEFFAIVIWKANRAKSRIKTKLKTRGRSLSEAVKDLTRQIHDAETDEERLTIVLNEWDFALPMASAILAVLYQDRFTVYDIRVRDELGIQDFAGRKDQIKLYFSEFMPKVRAVDHPGTLREKDRYLWGKSWYHGLQALVET